MRPGNFQRSGRGGVSLIAASVCGAFLVLGSPGVASAQSGSGASNAGQVSGGTTGVRPGGGVRSGWGVRARMPRSVIDHTRGRLTPGAKLPRIANRIPTQRRLIPSYEERQERMRRIRRAPAASAPASVSVVEANQRVWEQFSVPGVEFYRQRGGLVGDVFMGPRVIAVPDDAPRTRTEYRGMLVDGRCAIVPVEVPIDYSAPPRVDQRVRRGAREVSDRSFIGPGRIVGG